MSFCGEIKSIFHHFNGFSAAKNYLRPESAPLRCRVLADLLGAAAINLISNALCGNASLVLPCCMLFLILRPLNKKLNHFNIMHIICIFFFVMSYESRFHTKRFSIYPLMPDGRKRSYALKQSSS